MLAASWHVPGSGTETVTAKTLHGLAPTPAGRIVETGPAADVLADPAHPYTRKLIDCVPVLGEPGRSLDAIRGLPPAVNRLPPGCAFADRCPRAADDCREGHIGLDSIGGGRAVRCLKPMTEPAAESGT